MTQTEFYNELGIKKAYFYDIVSGRINSPPHDLQFRAVQLLKSSEPEKEKFFDLAAKIRGDMPADIERGIANNPKILEKIRTEIKKEN